MPGITAAGHLAARRPDDRHMHPRDGAMPRLVLPWTVAHLARSIIVVGDDPVVVLRGGEGAFSSNQGQLP